MGGGNQQHSTVTLELYVRSLSPAGAREHQERTLERIATLEDDGTIAGYDVHVWGDQLCLSAAATRTDAGQFVRNRVSEFKQWARENDVSFEGGFDAREVASAFTGEEHTVIEFPVTTLAEFRGDDLVSVAPGKRGESTYTVVDRLDALADGMDTSIEASDESFRPMATVSPAARDRPTVRNPN